LACRLAFEVAGGAGEEPQVVRAERHLVAGNHQRLADVARLDLSELLGVVLDHVGELQQQGRTLARRCVEPFRKCLLRPLDDFVDLVGRHVRYRVDRLGSRGVDHVDGCHLASYSVRRIPLSRVSRCASATGMIVSARIRKTTTFTCGNCCPSRIWPKIQIGSVFCAPVVKVVTITSSKESAKASRAPEMSAVEMVGSVTKRKV